MPGFGPVTCYWLAPTSGHRRHLRRYVSSHHGAWTCEAGWHSAMADLDVIDVEDLRREAAISGDRWPHDDARWPTHCDAGCGYAFTDADTWQLFVRQLYARSDTKELVSLDDAPPGAMYDADWLPTGYLGLDGIHLAAKCPNGQVWYIDGPASRPAPGGNTVEGGRWTRSGRPPHVTVSASIAIGYVKNDAGEWVPAPDHYHGHLVDGTFTAG